MWWSVVCCLFSILFFYLFNSNCHDSINTTLLSGYSVSDHLLMPLGRSRLASRLNYQHLSVTSGLYPFAGSPLHSKHRFNKPHHHKQMWHQEHRLVSVLFLKTHPNFPYFLHVQSLLLWVSVTAVVVWTRFIGARGAVHYVVRCAICDDAMQISAIS